MHFYHLMSISYLNLIQLILVKFALFLTPIKHFQDKIFTQIRHWPAPRNLIQNEGEDNRQK